MALQNYKGDEIELKYRNAATGNMDIISNSLNEFFINGGTVDDFLLMLYDSGRVPYSNRIKREAFVSFYKGALENFAFIGTFDSYVFILREIFGPDSDLIFEVPAPGKLSIAVNASSDIISEAIVRELSSGEYSYFNLSTGDGDDIVFRGLSGIETEAELYLLFSEIMPAGLVPTISLDYFLKSTFYSVEGSDVFDMITRFGDELIFIEVLGS